MQFSNTTLKNGIVQLAEWGLGFPDGAISGDSYNLAIFTSIANSVQYDLLMAIMRSVDGWDIDDKTFTDYGISTTPLIANQRDYTFPTNLLKINRVDVTYDGTNWYRATPIDSTELGMGLGNDAVVDSRFNVTQPRYDAKNGSLFLYPRATASTGSIRIEFPREIDPFLVSSTTKEPGIDKAFHDLLVTGIKLKWAIAQDMEKAKNLKVLYDEKMVELGLYYGDKVPDEGLAIVGNTEYNEYR
jgi:hypothetical protein